MKPVSFHTSLKLSDGMHGNFCDHCGSCGRRTGLNVVMLAGRVAGCSCITCEIDHPSLSKAGWIYVAGYGCYWKCGKTRGSIEKRIGTLQTGFPHKLRVAGAWLMADCLMAESAAHFKLRRFHYRAEWFECSESDLLSELQNEHHPLWPSKQQGRRHLTTPLKSPHAQHAGVLHPERPAR